MKVGIRGGERVGGREHELDRGAGRFKAVWMSMRRLADGTGVM